MTALAGDASEFVELCGIATAVDAFLNVIITAQRPSLRHLAGRWRKFARHTREAHCQLRMGSGCRKYAYSSAVFSCICLQNTRASRQEDNDFIRCCV